LNRQQHRIFQTAFAWIESNFFTEKALGDRKQEKRRRTVLQKKALTHFAPSFIVFSKIVFLFAQKQA
jgi:hypothetical protein